MRRVAFFPFLSLLLIFLLSSCGGGGDGGDSAGSTGAAPIATSVAATSINENNATLNGTVNPNGLATRAWFEYGTDPGLVKDALLEAAERTENVLKSPLPMVLFREFGDSSMNFELLVWIDHPKKRFETESDLHFEIVKQFKQQDITIPFPQQDVHIRSVKDVFPVVQKPGD